MAGSLHHLPKRFATLAAMRPVINLTRRHVRGTSTLNVLKGAPAPPGPGRQPLLLLSREYGFGGIFRKREGAADTVSGLDNFTGSSPNRRAPGVGCAVTSYASARRIQTV
jgi:hypothetical protein